MLARGMSRLWGSNLENLPIWIDLKETCHWCKINYVIVGKTNEGPNKKVFKVEYCETKPSELIDYLKPKLQEFVIHNFTFKW
jgi:hypothetical protein